MLRLVRRAALLFATYTALILAVVVAGFLAGAVGIWASILWGAAIVAAVTVYIRTRSQGPSENG